MSMFDQIKHSIPIVDVLERYAGVTLPRAKINKKSFNIRCPFHSDKSPSFTVYPSTNKFRCWAGCNNGKTGSVIDVVMLTSSVDVKEAIAILKEDYGLEQPNSIQTKEWRMKRAVQEYTAAQKKQLYKTCIEAMAELKKVELLALNATSRIKIEEDLDKFGGCYHLIVQIEYWLECLTFHNPNSQIETLIEINRMLEKVITGVGENA